MAVRIRLKRLGRRHRPFFRVCAMDSRAPRDGRVIEELGTYDPMIPETDARAQLKGERIDYWLGVGAQPSDKVKVLIKKYGTEGTHLEAQQAALERIAVARATKQKPVEAPKVAAKPAPAPEAAPPADEAPAEEAKADEAAAEATDEAAAEAPAEGGEES